MHRRLATHMHPDAARVADLVESAPVVKYVNVVELHDDIAAAIKDKDTQASKQTTTQQDIEKSPPSPSTSFPTFDLTGKLAGDYDPFSQVRHLVDGVFKQHEAQLEADSKAESQAKSAEHAAASSFLEVTSFTQRHHRAHASSSHPSALLTPIASSEFQVHQGTALLLPSSYSMRPTLASTAVVSSLPIRFQSPTIMSSSLGSDEMRADQRPALYEGDEIPEPESSGGSFLEVSSKVTKVQSFCEICILVMQMKERGEPHLCAGLNANYYITCVEVLESILRADKALVYWLKEGCMHLDSDGPEIVRPCPAINICSWVPNLFTPPPTIVRDEVEALCPKDLRFLPTIPEEYRALLGASRRR